MSSVFSIMTSPRIETAKIFLDAFADLSESRHLSVRSADCTHIYAPASLNPFPPTDNATFAAQLAGVREVMAGFPVTAKEMIDSAEANTVTVWATSEALFHEDVKDDGLSAAEWAFRGEYVFIISMDPSGRRIRRIVEFLDSKGTERMWGLIARAKENRRRLGSKAGVRSSG